MQPKAKRKKRQGTHLNKLSPPNRDRSDQTRPDTFIQNRMKLFPLLIVLVTNQLSSISSRVTPLVHHEFGDDGLLHVVEWSPPEAAPAFRNLFQNEYSFTSNNTLNNYTDCFDPECPQGTEWSPTIGQCCAANNTLSSNLSNDTHCLEHLDAPTWLKCPTGTVWRPTVGQCCKETVPPWAPSEPWGPWGPRDRGLAQMALDETEPRISEKNLRGSIGATMQDVRHLETAQFKVVFDAKDLIQEFHPVPKTKLLNGCGDDSWLDEDNGKCFPLAKTIVVGAFKDASLISSKMLEYIYTLSCVYGFPVNVISGQMSNSLDLRANYENITREKAYPSTECAEFKVVEEPPTTTSIKNRVDRLAFIRDYQRALLREPYMGQSEIVVVLDFDMMSAPDIKDLLRASFLVASKDYDILCSVGTIDGTKEYYDTFATVLYPDVFVYPMQGRLIQEFSPGERESPLIQQNGEPNASSLFAYFVEGKQAPTPVLSCFGGLAIYSSERFWDQECHYTMETTRSGSIPNSLLRYVATAGNINRPCEHIVFHQCLSDRHPSLKIAVHPNLTCSWDKKLHSSMALLQMDRPVISGETIYLDSINVFLKQRKDGDFVIFRHKKPIFSSGAVSAVPGLYFTSLEGAGALVTYRGVPSSPGLMVYSSTQKKAGLGNYYLSLELATGNLTIKDHANETWKAALASNSRDVETVPSATPSSETLKIAWLMSFPNSGTSYTLHLVEKVSRRAVATNYGYEENVNHHLPNVPVFEDSDGPFVIAKRWPQPMPSTYIITKTHCEGYCIDCGQERFILARGYFRRSCAMGTKQSPFDRSQYNDDMVAKALHLIRNPINNIVSRFRLERKRHLLENDLSWVEEHPNDRKGLLNFCADIDLTYFPHEAVTADPSVMEDLALIPCRTDLYRYIRWHDSAFAVTNEMGLPTLIIHYEDYEAMFDDTLSRILAFLEVDDVHSPPPFHPGKNYYHFFTKAEREAVFRVIQKLASPDLIQNLRRYMNEESQRRSSDSVL